MGTPPLTAALAMLDAFASVGAIIFDVSITDINQDPVEDRQRTRENLQQLRRRIGLDLQAAARNQHNVIIRPRSRTALLIQVDDYSPEKAAQIAPYAFMTIETSPGNSQVWLAVSDAPKESDKEAAKQFRKRVRRGTGSDKSATGATRIAGSINFKTKYAPDFPMVRLSQVNHGNTITTATLDQASLIARDEPSPPPPASVPQIFTPKAASNRKWPDYQRVLQGAPPKSDGNGPDRSLADFMWSKFAIQRGWSIDETAAMLVQVSEKAQQQARRNDEGYARVTAYNAAKAVERDRGGQRPRARSTLGREI